MALEGGAKQEPEARGEREDDVELRSMVEHWVAVIDRWVRKFDEEMGEVTAGGGKAAGGEILPADASPAQDAPSL